MSNDGGEVVPGREEAGYDDATAPSGGFRKGAFGVSGSGDTSGFGGLVRVEPGGAVALHSTDRPYGGELDPGTPPAALAGGAAPHPTPGRRGLAGPGGSTHLSAPGAPLAPSLRPRR